MSFPKKNDQTVNIRAQAIRDRMYAGEISKETAFDCVKALAEEYAPPNRNNSVLYRKLEILGIVRQYLEPDV